MSPKKITEADKLEIVDLYRQTRDTTTSLANRYGVSNSTIGRLLKTSIPEAEYELLIQQKRAAKGSGNEDNLVVNADTDGSIDTQPSGVTLVDSDPSQMEEEQDRSQERQDPVTTASDRILYPAAIEQQIEDKSLTGSIPTQDRLDLPSASANSTEDVSASKRLVRRRSSARLEELIPARVEFDLRSTVDLETISAANLARISPTQTLATSDDPNPIAAAPPTIETKILTRNPGLPVLRELASNRDDYPTELVDRTPIKEPIEDDVEEDSEDVNALAAMFGEEIAEGDDDDDDDDWDEQSVSIDGSSDRDLLLTGDRSQIQVTPLSQATLPRTCYIVIDKFAELIVRPLKDFAELGQIPSEEIQQSTLPIFDNHRVAKRFSNQRTQRVIKVPDSRVFQKTIGHLRSKGIARLLVDGNIYSLN